MLNKLIDFLESQVNKAIYVWGAQGQAATNELIEKSNNTSLNKKRAKKMLADRIAAGIKKILAFDCSGLLVYWLFKNGLIKSDMSSRTMYAICEKLKRSQLKKGDWVFKYSYTSGRIVHVGCIVDDDLNVIHDKGSKYGVIKEPLNKSTWNRYGRPPYFKDEVSEDEEMINGNSEKTEIKQFQIYLEKAGFKGDMNSDYYGQWGSKTEKSVKAFQKAYGLAQTGVGDCATMLKLVEVLSSNSADVVKLIAENEALRAKITKAINDLK